MAVIYPEPSRTFSEYILIPNLTKKEHMPENVSLKTPLVKFKKGEDPELNLNIPFVSAIMQAVSDHNMAIALARSGGLSFIFGSQSIASQAEMVRKVKHFKAGFVESDSNLKPSHTLREVLDLHKITDHTTIAITEDGSPHGKFLGMLTSRDFRLDRHTLDTRISEVMTPFDSIIYARDGISLMEANDMIWEHKLNCLPVLDQNDNLLHLVFRKDYDAHQANPLELVDREKRIIVGAGINSRDHAERVPELIKAGADILCIDSSDGYSEWQHDTIKWIRSEYGDKVKVGAGNVVDQEGFYYLAEAGADFIKVGIGGGAICITREQKGIGRGQASAVVDVAKARDDYFKKTGYYVPLCSDGGIVHDYHLVLALAMGADFVMMGRYFARFDESPSKKVLVGGNYMKEFWGEGSARARNWQRYGYTEDKLSFEEGVDAFVPYAGKLKDNLELTLTKIKSTMCNLGSLTIKELQQKARITAVSSTSIREGSAHDVVVKDSDVSNYNNR
ncbi:MAG: IMP dehydrogenase [Spirochaetales bacterium]|nr:IMP dehydrogenase [Spirochaetales bacterium]